MQCLCFWRSVIPRLVRVGRFLNGLKTRKLGVVHVSYALHVNFEII
jgi:hypothetical protein